MTFLKAFISKKWFWVALIFIFIGIWYFFFKNSGSEQLSYTTQAVQKQTIISSVSGTGQVLAENQLDIKPSGSSKITQVWVKQGQEVKTGDKIVMLDQTSVINSLVQARASLTSAKANYDAVVSGSTDSELKLAQLSVDSAKNAYDKALADMEIIKKQQDQTLKKSLQSMLNHSLVAEPEAGNISSVSISLSGSYLGTEKGKYTITVNGGGEGLFYVVSGLENYTNNVVSRGLAYPLGNSGLYITFGASGSVVSGSVWNVEIPNVESAGYINSVNDYNSALLNQQQVLQNAQNTINTTKLAYENAQTQFQQKVEGSTSAQVSQAAAQLASAQAQLYTAQNNYQNNIITAPFDGVIAQLNAKVGEQVSGNTAASGSTNLATLITKTKMVTISLNEVDANKVKPGQKAVLSFDALPDSSLTGTVSTVDEIGTVTQGVVSYGVKILLDTDFDSVKTSMSVNAQIITDSKQDVLSVPLTAIKTDNEGSYVEILDNKQVVKKIVTTGFSNDIDIEIVEGLTEGQEVILKTNNQTSTNSNQNTQRTGGGLFPVGGNVLRAR